MEVEFRQILWEDIHARGSKFFSKKRQLYLLKYLSKDQKILNIGVGDLSFEKLARKKGFDIYSIDPDAETIFRLQQVIGGNARVGLIQNIPFTDCMFDVVVVSEVLEHLNDEELNLGLFEAHRVLKRNGLLIGTVPAEEDLEENMVFCPYCKSRFHKWGHLLSFSEDFLHQVLSSKFRDIYIRRIYIQDSGTLNWKGKLCYLMKNVLLGLGIKGKGERFFFKAFKQ